MPEFAGRLQRVRQELELEAIAVNRVESLVDDVFRRRVYADKPES